MASEPIRVVIVQAPTQPPPTDTSWIRHVCACCGREQHVPLWRRLWEKVAHP